MQVWLGHCPEESSITAWRTRLMMTWAQPYLCSFTQHPPRMFILCLSLDHTTSTFCMCIHASVGAPSLPQWSCLLLCWPTSMYPFKTYLVHDFNLSSIRKQSTSESSTEGISVQYLLYRSFHSFVLFCQNMDSSWERALHCRISILETVVRPKRPVNTCSAVVPYPPYLKLSQGRPTRGLS